MFLSFATMKEGCMRKQGKFTVCQSADVFLFIKPYYVVIVMYGMYGTYLAKRCMVCTHITMGST